jgi:hypothetical protein
MELDGWTIFATVILIARPPNEEVEINGKKMLKIPVFDLGPLPPI